MASGATADIRTRLRLLVPNPVLASVPPVVPTVTSIAALLLVTRSCITLACLWTYLLPALINPVRLPPLQQRLGTQELALYTSFSTAASLTHPRPKTPPAQNTPTPKSPDNTIQLERPDKRETPPPDVRGKRTEKKSLRLSSPYLLVT